MAENPFLAAIFMFGGNFAPRGYALCNGQLMSIAQNTALFSLIGTTYGGDGVQTFGLPDLRGRAPLHMGQGPGLSLYDLGQSGGTESVVLTTGELPSHNHQINVGSAETTNAPSGALPAQNGSYATGSPTGQMAANAVAGAGSNQAHPNLQPYLTVNFIIALQGIFPSRN
jgi:microcystin-dependent protein